MGCCGVVGFDVGCCGVVEFAVGCCGVVGFDEGCRERSVVAKCVGCELGRSRLSVSETKVEDVVGSSEGLDVGSDDECCWK